MLLTVGAEIQFKSVLLEKKILENMKRVIILEIIWVPQNTFLLCICALWVDCKTLYSHYFILYCNEGSL